MTRVSPNGRKWVAAAVMAAGLFCALVAIIPTAERHGLSIASYGRLALGPACHQIPDRCLDLGDGPLPVCARCFGLYVGGLSGLLFTVVTSRRLRPRWSWLVLGALPTTADFIAGQLGLPSLANIPRFAVALLPGMLLGLVLADAICATVDLNSRGDHVE